MEISEYVKFKSELEKETSAEIAKVLANACGKFKEKTGLVLTGLELQVEQSVLQSGPSRETVGHVITGVTLTIHSNLRVTA